MRRVTVTLPEEIHEQLKTLAQREGVSVSHYIAYAIARQVDAVEEARKTEPAQAPIHQTSRRNDVSLGLEQALKIKQNSGQATTLGMTNVDVNHL